MGLLEYLEDIIGTNQYVSRIDELGKRLEEARKKPQGCTAARVAPGWTEGQEPSPALGLVDLREGC